jgi:hypothetical protein
MSVGGGAVNPQPGFLPAANSGLNAGLELGSVPHTQSTNEQIGQLGSNQNIASAGQLGSNQNISAVNTSIANSLATPQSAPPINYLSGYFQPAPHAQLGAHRTNSLLNDSYYGSLGGAPFAQQFQSNLYLNQVSSC